MSKKIPIIGYTHFFQDIKQRIKSAQYEALKSVNKEMIRLYWDIGKKIVDSQQKHGWGKSIVESLAKDLQAEFSGISGFSADNLWRMRKFYLNYKNKPKLAPLVQEIAWAHNIVILEKCKDDLAREFYIRMTKKFGWTKNVLIHQIENQSYEKTLLNQTNFSKTLPAKIKGQAQLAVRDEYTFDFLELSDEHREKDLERAMIAKVNQFLIEMGGAFAFMGNQYRLEIDGEEYFIDLLLYHRRLKCLVAIELKIGKFLPEYVGKMQFYLSALDNVIKEKTENPSIGIILCKEKNRTIVEYALKNSRKPIAVANYRITSTLPKELRKELPAPDQIRQILEKMQ
ncbi:MAG: PDDEXK nuclease domain-containing protein [Candidatus Margulisbacteria bacterium]|jgi:predicted nuclease of restriction endonuclease-like (RecB) superfamily|nr:PDDEXK nuclease domain-containing protein [Candidatus Margulisiibacteriota bacterium]